VEPNKAPKGPAAKPQPVRQDAPLAGEGVGECEITVVREGGTGGEVVATTGLPPE